MTLAVEVAQRVKAKCCTAVPGTFVNNREWDYQTANAIDNLRFAASTCEPSGLVMVLESLNPWRDHPGRKEPGNALPGKEGEQALIAAYRATDAF